MEKPPKNPYRGGSVTISCKFGICSLWTFPFSKPVQRCVPTAVSCITCAEAALPEGKRPYLRATGTLLSWGEQCLPTDMLSKWEHLSMRVFLRHCAPAPPHGSPTSPADAACTPCMMSLPSRPQPPPAPTLGGCWVVWGGGRRLPGLTPIDSLWG